MLMVKQGEDLSEYFGNLLTCEIKECSDISNLLKAEHADAVMSM
jgi:hypothetical protein